VSDAGSPLPPPPPSASPPPGYVGYEPNLSASVPLRRIGGLGKAMVILLGVAAVGYVIQALTIPSAVDSARDLVSGAIDEDQFNEDLAPFSLAGLLSGATFIALIVLTMIWLYRIVANHRTLDRRLTWGPGWAIGGWFLPPLVLYIIPMLVLSESWKASDPSVPPGDDRWRRNPVSPLVYIWWVLYGLVPIIFIIQGITFDTATFSQDAVDVADAIEDQQGFMIAQSLSGLASAVAFGFLVRALTARHARLTGESAIR
jgi:Domain of unknown function (DUF4328)